MLTFTQRSDTVIISGRTFYAKDKIKALGGKWSGSGTWSLPISMNTEENRAMLIATAEETYKVEKLIEKSRRRAEEAMRKYALTPEGRIAIAAQMKARIQKMIADDTKPHWICCEHCEIIDEIRRHTSCNVHAEDGNTFRVNGMLRTGD
jgi:hypothetical protein